MRTGDHSTLRTEAVRLQDGLALYKQPKGPGRGSPNWYARVNLSVGGRRLHTKSTGTSDLALARDRAREFYVELLVQSKGGIVPEGRLSDRAYRFDIIAEAWLDELERHAGTDPRSLRRYRDHRKIVTAPNGLIAFFDRRDIRTITTKLISDYLDSASRGSKFGFFKPTTKRNHLSTVSMLLNWAVDLGRLPQRPRMPTIRVKDNPRPSFDEWEYRCLRNGCEASVSHYRVTEQPEVAEQWQELLDYITFIVDCFLRPGEESMALQQKHIEIVEGEYSYLRIRVVHGKTGSRVTVSMPGAVETYRRILKRQGDDPERYLFMPGYANRNTAKERMGDRFNELLELTGLAFNAEGRKRTLYSLRHTALTLRLLQGDNVEVLPLARNAGTSPEMLDRFYCSGLEAERKIANLQSYNAQSARSPRSRPPSCIQRYVEAQLLAAENRLATSES